jgi:plastocyanin
MKSNSTQIKVYLPWNTCKKSQSQAGIDSLIRIILQKLSNSVKLVLAFALVYLFIPGQVFAQGSQSFTSSNTFTVPVGVTSITVECWGAGGGGGSRSINGAGGGGGGGAYASSVIAVVAGTPYTVTVGTGGSANSNGSNSSFGALVIAAGGGGGTNNSTSAGSGGAAASSTGTLKYSGGNGGTGSGTSTYSGGGGGGAGSTGAGGNATGQTAGTGTSLNGGNGGSGVTVQNNGNAGNTYGGGGSGALRTTSSRIGGSGANGLVVVSWTCPSATISYAAASYCTSVATPQSVIFSGSTGGTFSASPGGLTIDANTGAITPNTSTPNTYTVTYNIPAAGGCPELNATTTVAIYPTTLITGESLATQTQCQGAPFTPISVTVAGGGLTYQWYSNTTASNSGGTSLGAANGAQTESYTPQSTEAGTLYYYCIVHGDCGPDVTSNVSGAFVVNPATAISSQSTATQTQCIGGTFTPITVTATGTGTLTYQWFKNVASSNSGGISLGSANGAQTASYTPQATSTGVLYYYCIVTGTCGPVTSAVSGPFIVNQATAISGQNTGAQTECQGVTFSPISVTATGTAPFSYQWYSNTSASTTGGTSLGSANGAQTSTYTPQSTVAGTLYYYCIVTGTCGSQTSAISGAFTVNPATAISSQSTATQTECINGTFTPITVTAVGTGALSYQWYGNSAPSTSGGTSLGAANGAQTSSYTPQANSIGTLYYYCVVHSSCGTDITSNISGAFIVNPNTAITGQLTDGQTQCLNGPFDPIAVTAVGAGLTYQWYSNTTASTTGGTSLGSANGAQTSTFIPQSAIAGTKYYYCIVSGDCGTNITSNISGAFVVNPATQISGQSTATQTQCLGGSFTPISVTATGTEPLNYQWYSNTTASTTGGISLGSANGAQTNTYTPQALSSGTLYYYCIVHGICGADAISSVSEAFIVNPASAITSQSTAAQSQCINGVFTPISVNATGTGTITYQWYSNTTPSTSGGTSLGTANGAQTSSYTPQATSAGTLYYYCIVHSDCGANVLSAVSGAFTVNPVSIGGNISGGSSPITYGSTTGTLSVTGQTGVVVKWQKMVDAGAWTDINITTTSYSEIPVSVGTWQYRVQVKSGECTEAYSSPLAIIVSPKTVTITPTAGQSKIFGDADPPLTYTNSEWGDNSNLSGVLGRSTGEDVGNYPYNLASLSAGSNYTLVLAAGTQFSITPKYIVVTPVGGQTKVFGDSDPTPFTYTNTALVGADVISGLMGRGTGENAGDYLYTLGTLDAGANYTLSIATSPKFIITARPVLITPVAGQTKVFGDADPTPFAYTNTPLIGVDAISGQMGRAAGTDVGNYIFNTGTLTAGANYTLTVEATPTFSITPKPIVITANAGQTKAFGSADPVSFTYTNTPLIGADVISGALARASGENVGDYAYSIGSLTASSNYTLTVAPTPLFSITPKSIIITGLAGQSKIYGEADPAVFNYTFAPALEGSDVITGSMERVSGENAGNYLYKIGSLTAGPNYILSIVPSPAFTILPMSVVITPDPDQTKVVGAADPVFTYTFAPALLGTDGFTGQLSRDAGETVGVYDYLLGTLSAGINYSLSIVGTNTFSIVVSTGVEDLQGNDGLKFINYPNPFRSYTTLSYTLPVDGRVTITISDMHGKLVKTVISDEMQTEGEYILTVNDWSDSGIYIATLKLKINDKELQRTIKLVKGN